ncbi:MAG: lysophospholipid acyltransferase family protein [Trueperaceae bacterium]
MAGSPPPPGRRPPPFYRLAVFLVRLFVRLLYGLRVTGTEHVPRTGACVVGANHASAWDPPVVGLSVPREIHFMAKKELFERWLPRRVFRALRAFPVDRGANDVGAVKEALRRLQSGHAIGVFFEGTRNVRGDAAAHMGAAFLAQRTGAPLVPAAIWREGRAFRVAFGPPLRAAGRTREDAAALTAELERAVRSLLPSRT